MVISHCLVDCLFWHLYCLFWYCYCLCKIELLDIHCCTQLVAYRFAHTLLVHGELGVLTCNKCYIFFSNPCYNLLDTQTVVWASQLTVSLQPLLSLLDSFHCSLRDIYPSSCLSWPCSPSPPPTLWVPAHQPTTFSLQPHQPVSARFNYLYLLGSCRTATISQPCQDTPHLDLLEGLCTLLQAMDPEEF